MIRNVGAVLAGLTVGSIVNMGVVVLNATVLFPVPPDLDLQDPVQLQAWVAAAPITSLSVVILAHLAQAGIGGWVAARLGGSHPVPLALIVGGLSALGGIANLVNLSAPTWMWIELPLYFVVSGAAGWLVAHRRS